MEHEKANPEDLIALAVEHQKTQNSSIAKNAQINAIDDAVFYFTTQTRTLSDDVIPAFRAAVRQQIQIDALTKNEEVPMIYTADFYGSGDSGQIDTVTGNSDVDYLLEVLVDNKVTFDWYNNDGGGGDITWDINTDKITINGYANVTTEEIMMENEEI